MKAKRKCFRLLGAGPDGLAAWALVVSAAMACAQAAPDRASAGLQALQRGDYAGALSMANEGLVSEPRDCRLLAIRGLALNGEGKPDLALAAFEQTLEQCPTSLPALEGAAQIEYARRAPGAASLLQRILALRPQDMTAHAMLAVLKTRAGDCAEALPHFEQSMPLIQKNAAAERQYGLCLLATARWDEAVTVFTHILQQEPNQANRLALAAAQEQANHLDDALTTVQPLLDKPAPNERALRLGAEIAEKKGDTPQAVAWLREAILQKPDEPENYLSFAALSFTHASYQVGVDMLDTGLRKNPDDARLYLARGVLLVQLSKFEEALQDFSRAHALDPKLSLAEDAVGMMRSQQHQPEASLAVYRRQAQQHPNDALLQYLYAEALSEKAGGGDAADLTASISAARRSLAIEPAYQPARDLLCALYVRTQQFEKAVAEAQEALRRDPEDQQALYQQIMAERRLGDKAKLNVLVAKLNELRSKEKGRRTQYLLQEAGAEPAVSQ